MIKISNIKALIEDCVRRDEAAWSKFISHFSGLIHWAIGDRLKRWGTQFSNEDIEDIRQQLFSSLWEKNRLAEVRDREKIGPWLAIVAANFAFNYMRSRNRATPPILESIFKQDLRIENIADTRDTYSILEDSEIRTLTHNFIDRLPSYQQTILVLSYFYGKRHKEIAEILKIPINTVSTIIKRAKDSLSEELRVEGFGNF